MGGLLCEILSDILRRGCEKQNGLICHKAICTG
jgi:hypothetical protein